MISPASSARRRRALGLAAGAPLLVALLGGLATDIGPWYQALRQPAPLFKKLDESIVEEEYARLEA